MITGEEWEIVDKKKNWEKGLQREEIEKALDHGFYFLEANGKGAEYMSILVISCIIYNHF